MFPLLSVEVIALASNVKLSTSKLVNPFISVLVAPSATASDPIVIELLANDTAPLDTLKSPPKEAIPLLEEEASSPEIVRVSVPLTTASIPSPAVTVRVSPPEIVSELDPSVSVNEVDIEPVLAAVIRPLASTVIIGIAVVLP